MFDPRLLLVLGLVGGGVVLQGPLGESNAVRRANDFRYVPDVDISRAVAVGHRSTLANILWLKSLPDLGREFDDLALKKRWIAGVLETTTALEPTFYTVYDYGATYLTMVDRDPTAALELVQQGVDRFADLEAEYDGLQLSSRTQLLRKLAMIHYMDRHDRDTALPILDEAVARADCDILTRMMWSQMRVERGGEVVALAHWAELIDSHEGEVRFAAERNLEMTKRNIANREWTAFEEREGRVPATVEEWRAASTLPPEAADLVYANAEISEAGKPHYPKFAEYERESWRRSAESAAFVKRRDDGEWPQLEWVLGNPLSGKASPPPPGMRWHFDGGDLTAVPNE